MSLQPRAVREFIDEGLLCDARYFAVHPLADPAEFSIHGALVTQYQRICSGKRTIVYCASIEHAKAVAEQFSRAGIPASEVTSKQNHAERKEIIARYKKRELLVLTTCHALDDQAFPETEAVILASPTRSSALHTQQLASAMRPIYAEGMPADTAEQRRAAIAASTKPQAIIIDLAGNIQRLGVMP